MTHTLFIHFRDPIAGTLPDGMAVEWVLLNKESKTKKASTGSAALAQALRDALALEEEITHVVALIPGEHVLVTTVPIHRKQKAQIAAALHYAVEDQLAAPVDSVHAALGEELPDGASADMQPYLVAVVKKDIMDAILNALKAFQVVADVVTSDAFLMPYDADHISVFLEGGRALLSAAPALVTAVEQRNMELLLSSHIADPAIAPAHPSTLHLYSDASGEATATRLDAWAIRHALRFEYSAFDEPPLAWLCRHYSAAAPRLINLLQGPYKPQTRHLLQWASLKPIAATVLLFFFVNVLIVLGKTYYFQSSADALHEQSTREYRRLFPADTRIVDLKAQLQQHLDQHHLQAGDKSFLGLLSELATKASPGWPEQVTVHRMEYDEQSGTITLEVQAPDIARLDALKALLTSSSLFGGMDSVSQNGNAASSRITVSLQKSGTP